VDRLIDLASTALEESERKKYYAAAQKIIAEDAAYIPIWNRTNATVARPAIGSVRLGPTGDFAPLRNATKGVAAGN
jgi:ABC-type transport system substrate-binding protein